MAGLLGRLLRLGVPIGVGRLGAVAMGITDLIVVGHLAPDQVAWLAISLNLVGPCLIAGIGLLLGVQLLGARADGEGDPAAAADVWHKGMVIGVCAGLLAAFAISIWARDLYLLFGIDVVLAGSAAGVVAVLSFSLPLQLVFIASTNFLEGLRRPVPGMVAMWVATGVNLAATLILVSFWGAVGSAWATLFTRLLMAAGVVAFIVWSTSLREYRGTPRAPIGYRRLLGVGTAAAVGGLVEAGAFAAMGIIAARIGASSVAATELATGGLLTLVSMISLGIGSAAAVLVSQEIGRGRWRESRRIGAVAMVTNFIVMAAIGIACARFSGQVAFALTSNPQVVVVLSGAMWLVALLITPDCGQMVADPVLRAAGHNWIPTAVRLFCFVLIAPCLAIWLVQFRHWDVSGVFVGLIVASSTAWLSLLAVWLFQREPLSPRRSSARDSRREF